jgi:hypothetical protein
VVGVLAAVSCLCIVPILIGLRLPAVQKVRAAAARVESHKNLNQIAAAMHNYNSTYGQFPPAVVYDRNGKPLYSWRVLLLPFLEQESIYRSFHLDEPWDSPHNKKLLLAVKVYLQPGEVPREPYATHYQVLDGPGAAFDSDPRNGLIPFGDPKLGLQQSKNVTRINTFLDGTSNTILIAEARDPVPWTQPVDLRWDPKGPLPKLGLFDGDFNVAMADGSTHTVHKGVSEQTLRAAITANGGEILGQDW